MDQIGSMADSLSELARGFAARKAFTATLTIVMILATVTMDRFQRVGNSRSITFMRTRRETAKVTSEMPGTMGAVNEAPDPKGAMAAADMVAAVTARARFKPLASRTPDANG
jgi:hypothetical protein